MPCFTKFTSLLLIFYMFNCLKNCDAKSFTKCQLATELVDNGISQDDVGVWLCIIGQIRDSSKKFGYGHDYTYGLFYISGKWWCTSKTAPYTNNGCNLDCDKLIDDDLSDDISCALHIFKSGGYEQWGFRSHSCTRSGKVDISDCFRNSTVTA